MTAFLLAAAALALAALLPLSRTLLAAGPAPRAWRTALTLAIGLPLAAAGLYAHLGRPEALAPPLPEATAPNPVQQMVQRLADRLQRTPDDADGWALLARAYEQLGRPRDALPAYAQLERLRPDDAQVWSQHAVTLALVKGEGLAGEPEALLKRALALDPRHVPALALLAAAAQERGDAAAARKLWARVLAEAPEGSEVAGQARESLRSLRDAP
ncbi:tetratricopeptide repeat protein [Pelomonas sp. P7]|uniref:Tetratricopeptide repeat protein n=1 Tax=Pelomonas caseinilytica TaxID=2906763 RepID=A0ABS8XM69_9BURK|nr:tetratricopeptide repeat protein [Pelomonas sp. P7]MCE4539691.1 tetratricopeptide repeat protein [Pelomonas sp. P7]